MLSLNFTNKLFESIAKLTSVKQISKLNLHNQIYSKQEFDSLNSNREEVLHKLGCNISRIVSSHKVQYLMLGVECHCSIFKQLSHENEVLENLYVLVVRDLGNVSKRDLFHLLKRTPNLCHLRLNIAQIGESNDEFTKQLIE